MKSRGSRILKNVVCPRTPYLLKHDRTRQDILTDDTFTDVVQKAFTYYQELVAPRFQPRLLNESTESVLYRLSEQFKHLTVHYRPVTREQITEVFDQAGVSNHSAAYRMLYACLFGDKSGPRLDRYINRLGVQAFCTELESRIKQAVHYRESETMSDTRSNQATTESSEAPRPMATIESPRDAGRVLDTIDFEEVKARAAEFAHHLRSNSEAIAESLSGFECYNVAVDEIERCVEFLERLEFNSPFFERRVRCVTSYLPLNQPIYATTCFGIIPSLLADSA